MDLFKELLPSIMQNKKHILEEEKEYNAFIVNKALSYHADCLMEANQMNCNYNLDNKPQYDYLINKVRPRKRPYVKWEKPVVENDLLAVTLFFGYSERTAKEALKLLSEEQLVEIRKITNTGD